jgi:poly(3-hydroxybutyrate) depolymerase
MNHPHQQNSSILKIAVIGAGVILFGLLNFIVLSHPDWFIPSDRTRRILWFGLNPEYWSNWCAEALWTLAVGFLFLPVLRIPKIQNVIGRFLQILFNPILLLCQRWTPYWNKYPLERQILSCSPYFFDMKKLPVLVWGFFAVLTLWIVLFNTPWYGVILAFFTFIPGIPAWLIWILGFEPLYQLRVDGTVSWRLILLILLGFLAFIGGYFIIHSPRRQEKISLLVHYLTVGISLTFLGWVSIHIYLFNHFTCWIIDNYKLYYIVPLCNFLYFSGKLQLRIVIVPAFILVLLAIFLLAFYRQWIQKTIFICPQTFNLILLSINVLFVLLIVFCFVFFYRSDMIVVWYDVRSYPLCLLLLPLSLTVFSLSGLIWTRKQATGLLLVLVLLFISPETLFAAEPSVLMVEPAKQVSAGAARTAAQKTSQQASTDGGFMAEQEIVDCFAVMEYCYTGGQHRDHPIRFRMRMPTIIKPDQTYPLIVWFHGQGERGDDNTRQLSHLQYSMEFFAGRTQKDFFMIALQYPSNDAQWTGFVSTRGKGNSPLTITGEILEAVIHEFPVDEDRISVAGLSSGGINAWNFIHRHPRRFAALGVISAQPPKNVDAEVFLSPVIWAFHNRNDEGTPSDETERFLDTINAHGGNAFLTLYEDSGHDAWTRAMQEHKIISWLILQNLARPGPPQGLICRSLSLSQQFVMFGLPVLLIALILVQQFIRKPHGDPSCG